MNALKTMANDCCNERIENIPSHKTEAPKCQSERVCALNANATAHK